MEKRALASQEDRTGKRQRVDGDGPHFKGVYVSLSFETRHFDKMKFRPSLPLARVMPASVLKKRHLTLVVFPKRVV
jgi:hypothetical protein